MVNIKKLLSILKDKSGSTFPLMVAITLSLVIVFCGVSEYLRLLVIAQGVRDAVQEAVISTVNDNYANVYHGVREGYSGAYQPVAEDFEESLDYGDIYGRLDGLLGLTRSGGYHSKLSGTGETEFAVWNLSVHIKNAPLAAGDVPSSRFIADCTIELSVPVRFGTKLLPPMRMTVKTSAGYTPRF